LKKCVKDCPNEGRFHLKLKYGDGSGLEGYFCSIHLSRVLGVSIWQNIKSIQVKETSGKKGWFTDEFIPTTNEMMKYKIEVADDSKCRFHNICEHYQDNPICNSDREAICYPCGIHRDVRSGKTWRLLK
jgi:hypothetical protein